jgi:putative ABC transport system permease protein
MLIYDLTRISLKQIYRNKRRYKSVIIGISLGIAGLVTIITMGQSVESDLSRNLELLGSTTIIKATWDTEKMTQWHNGQYYQNDVDELRQLPGCRFVSPIVWTWAYTFSRDRTKIQGRLMGVESNFFDAVHLPVETGQIIGDNDLRRMSSVCVLGRQIKNSLFKSDENPVGSSIFIDGNMFTVIGILGGIEDPLFDETILIPFTVARSRFAYMYEIKDIYVRAVNWDIVGQLQQQIYELLLRNRPTMSDSVEVRSFPERIQTVQRAVLLVKVFLYFALLVTLVLGGLGITNVMLAAVQERTTEIGLRKAVGATDKMIMSQFLLESVCISFTGAIIGILCGYLLVEWLIRIFQTMPDQEVFYASLAGGVLFSVILGITSGLLPARKASQLDAAEAMSFE